MSVTLFVVDSNEDCVICPSTTCRVCLCEKLRCRILADYHVAADKLAEWKAVGIKGYSVKCVCSASSSSSLTKTAMQPKTSSVQTTLTLVRENKQ